MCFHSCTVIMSYWYLNTYFVKMKTRRARREHCVQNNALCRFIKLEDAECTTRVWHLRVLWVSEYKLVSYHFMETQNGKSRDTSVLIISVTVKNYRKVLKLVNKYKSNEFVSNLRSRNEASESTQLRTTMVFFSFIIISQFRRPIVLKFSHVRYFMHMLRYTKWEDWSFTITKGVQCL